MLKITAQFAEVIAQSNLLMTFQPLVLKKSLRLGRQISYMKYIKYIIKQNAVDGLLNNVLPTMPDYYKLSNPKSCKTLLKTKKKTPL
jgi:hypothetical protein